MIFSTFAQAGFNSGDLLFQLLAFAFLLTVPPIIVILFFVFKRRNDRLKRVEDKLDRLLADREDKGD
ncbi:hypothetical protein AF332_26315 [Sporosarcina globispora]|uniref:DUF4083 domain-containing protein n=1 Tax=Sporosarcina globispora TaxID=1459 RepID=A0A0M0GJA8_SPOGL|nr:hypothetical protein [Sporosarcina globispora]KON89990.1 hypothetical protein AF332_26315 [Sporosarcina globispora]